MYDISPSIYLPNDVVSTDILIEGIKDCLIFHLIHSNFILQLNSDGVINTFSSKHYIKMMHLHIATIFLVACTISCITADCYIDNGCPNTKTKKKEYRIGQRWRPNSDPCYTCKCVKSKEYVLACLEAINQKPKLSFKKSELIATFESTIRYAADEEMEINEREVKTKQCSPIRAPVYNLSTSKFESITYKTVYYFYTRKESRCCSRFSYFTNVHASCKVVKIGRCRSKLVKKENPKERCNMPMALIG
ncbi:uncharacterized protein LOC120348098 isoform X1 [Styela clava]